METKAKEVKDPFWNELFVSVLLAMIGFLVVYWQIQSIPIGIVVALLLFRLKQLEYAVSADLRVIRIIASWSLAADALQHEVTKILSIHEKDIIYWNKVFTKAIGQLKEEDQKDKKAN